MFSGVVFSGALQPAAANPPSNLRDAAIAAPPIGRRHERGFPVRISRRICILPPRRADRCNATWGTDMSNAQFVSSRAALASAALLSLALLAGCQNKDSRDSDVAGGRPNTQLSDSASGQESALAPISRASSSRVGDRVHFELDRYDLTPEAQATLRQQAALLQNYPQFVDHHRRACRRARDARIQPGPGRAAR